MGVTTTYEVLVLRGHDWIIDHVAEDRDRALHGARSLLDHNPDASVRVLEERFDPDSGSSLSSVIFKAQPKDKSSATFRRHRRPPPPGRGKPPRPPMGLVTRIGLAAIALTATAAGLLIGMAYLVDVFGQP